MAEQTDDFVASLKSTIRNEMSNINTAIDGVILDYANGIATVKPVATRLFEDGDSLPYPNLIQVPIRWPSFNGGRCGIKGPVRVGDSVLVVFSQQAIDGTLDQRRFDLSDAYAIPCGNAQQGQASNNNDMIMWFGDAFIKLTEAGVLEINAPGGCVTVSPSNEWTGTAKIAGLTSMNGGFDSTGQAINDGKNIGNDHRHSGVQSGASNTGTVV